MRFSISDTVNALSRIVEKSPVDWEAFDAVLSNIEDINFIDEDAEETILSEFLCGADYYHNGSTMPDAVRHFLANGYDVLANEGRNGGLALSQLCWSSYDKYILDAAKVLLDAGAPVDYRSSDDAPDEEPSGVLGSLGFKLPGAWVVDKDYTWANLLEAYYSIVVAVKKGKDYHQINSFLECLGRTLTGVSVIAADGGSTINNEGPVSTFSESLVLWFEKTPLVIRKYVDFVVDPITVGENSDRLQAADNHFASVIGHTLKEVQYLNQSTCYLEFENGVRVVLSSLEEGQDRIGIFEFSVAREIDFEKLEVDKIVRWKSGTYASTVTDYDEESMVIVSGDKACLLYTVCEDDSSYHIEGIECSRALLRDFVWQLPVQKPDATHIYYKDGQVSALRFDCGKEYLYFKTSEYIGFDICLSDECIDPNLRCSLRSLHGKHMEFKKTDLLNC